MREQIDNLIKLQGIETESNGIRLILSNVTQRLNGLSSRLSGVEQTTKNNELKLDELEKSYRLYKSDVEMNISKLKKSQERLASIKTNKEYLSLLKGIEDLKTINSQIEDQMLECLEQMDDIKKFLADRANEYKNFSGQVNKEKQTITHETEKNNKRLAELDTEWKKFSGKIDPKLLKIYLMVRDKAGGIAVTSVKDAVCCGCNMNIPPQMYNDLQRCDSLKFCPSCQRIIYWKDS
ncbi:MAG: C4-type zinc ribbon domain-containing protein [Deltaproteobacteria bacterium]|nr:C4-type zinc ribbon domain-containing protein [Deltaproteobacteria bacterium]